MAKSAPRLPMDPIAEARRQWVDHGWAEAADGMAAITSLMRAHQLAMSQVESVLKPFGVSFARYEVLMLLYFSSRGSLPMSTIGSRLQVHQTSVTNAVDRLEQAELVARMPHPTDRRTTLVRLTRGGRRLAERATRELNAQVFAQPGLEPDSLRALFDELAAYRRAAGDF
jgi:DNA-binding MarR family transcriptional regulator